MSLRENHVPERLLRHIWHRQYVNLPLRTTDGRTVVVYSSGEINEGGGPDFQNARVSIAGIVYRGDIELHRNPSGWYHHHHDRDPKYNRVILHVVLNAVGDQQPAVVESGRVLPMIVLDQFLPESFKGLLQKTTRDEIALHQIRCFRVNASIDAGLLRRWIETLAAQRLEIKITALEERLRQLAHEDPRVQEPRKTFGVIEDEGPQEDIPPPVPPIAAPDVSDRMMWEQVFYEGVMDGLGYSKNRIPFVRLARTVTLRLLRAMGLEKNRTDILSLLFGVGGLSPLGSDEATILERRWRALRRGLRVEILQKADWQLFPARPANLPTVRIQAASTIIQRIMTDGLLQRSLVVVGSDDHPREQRKKLRNLIQVTIDSPAGRKTVLGISRAHDIIANTVIPLSLLYARVFNKSDINIGAHRLYESYPPLSDNIILRQMKQQLLKDRLVLDSMSLQQGVLHLFHHYCSDERCRECEIGKVLFKGYIERSHARTS